MKVGSSELRKQPTGFGIFFLSLRRTFKDL